MRNLLFVLLASAFLFSCGNKNEEGKVTDLDINSFTEEAGNYVDQDVSITGTVVHICKHGGKKMHLIGNDDEKKIVVFTGEGVSEFPMELEGLVVKVTGKIVEEVYTAETILEWEAADAKEKEEAEAKAAKPQVKSGRSLSGSGQAVVPVPPQQVWDTLLDPVKLAAVIPGCRTLDQVAENSYAADISIGVGAVRGRFQTHVQLSELDPPNSVVLGGGMTGPLGSSSGEGHVTLTETAEGTLVDYRYEVDVTGKVAAIGGRMLDGTARVLVDQFFKRLIAQIEGRESWWTRLLKILGVGS